MSLSSLRTVYATSQKDVYSWQKAQGYLATPEEVMEYLLKPWTSLTHRPSFILAAFVVRLSPEDGISNGLMHRYLLRRSYSKSYKDKGRTDQLYYLFGKVDQKNLNDIGLQDIVWQQPEEVMVEMLEHFGTAYTGYKIEVLLLEEMAIIDESKGRELDDLINGPDDNKAYSPPFEAEELAAEDSEDDEEEDNEDGRFERGCDG